MSSGSDQPFFHQYETKTTISDICQQSNLVIYAGAGLTIDRSSLTWTAMIKSLLAPHVNTADLDLDNYIKDVGIMSAATTSYQLYRDSGSSTLNDVEAREKMTSTLWDALYGPGTWQRGTLADTVADFVYVWQATRDSGKHPNRTISLVTTNYDTYLCESLDSIYQFEKDQHKRRPQKSAPPRKHRVRFPTTEDRLINPKARLSPWVRNGIDHTEPDGSKIDCLYLHGRIPRYQTDSRGSRFPVVSELDYNATSNDSAKILASIFSKSSVVFVGSSISDGPLIQALLDTRDPLDRSTSHRRWAILTRPTIGGDPSSPASIESMRLTSRRLNNLGVTPIFIDFHVQAPQLFRELSICASFRKPFKYKRDKFELRYGQRLTSWWDEWHSETADRGAERRQRESHLFLRSILPMVRDTLGAPRSEVLKIEVWLRWKPGQHRKIRLWCSSAGTWAPVAAMPDAEIPGDSRFLSVEAFRSGRPAHRVIEDSRWKRYVAMPLWDESRGLLLGVVTIGTMGWRGIDSLKPEHNSARIAETFDLLHYAGMLVAQPKDTSLREELRELKGLKET